MSGVRCDLCPHNCILKSGQTGVCGVRENKKNRIRLKTYGRFSAVNLDPIEKKPLYHVYPGSNTLSLGSIGCNLRCPWCQNYVISQCHKSNNLTKLSISELLKLVNKGSYRSVCFTYNEPIISYEYIIEASKELNNIGIDTNIVTAGYINDSKLESFFKYITAVNVDLKSFDDNTYKKNIGGDLKTILNTLKYLAKSKSWLEITTLLIPGLNDSKKEITELSKWITKELGDIIPLHFSAFYPTYNMTDRDRTPEEIIEMARNIAINEGLKYVYSGNIIDRDGSTTFCPSCSTPLIVREGYKIILNRVNKTFCPKCNNQLDGLFCK